MPSYALDFSWLAGAIPLLLDGAATTLFLTVVTALIGVVLSILGAIGVASRIRVVRKLIMAYVEFIRNTPFLAQLFFIYFGLPSIGVMLDPVESGILALVINLTAYGIVIVGAGLGAVPTGQWEAGRSLALSSLQVFRTIILPQAVRIIFPALVSQIVITLLDSALVSQISVPELTYQAEILQAQTFRAFETYLVAAAIYLALSLLIRRTMFFGHGGLLPGAR